MRALLLRRRGEDGKERGRGVRGKAKAEGRKGRGREESKVETAPPSIPAYAAVGGDTTS